MIVLGFLIAGFGLFAAVSPEPVSHFELPVAQVGGGVSPEAVDIKPLSEMKYRNITRQSYDYSCGSAALVTLLNGYLDLSLSEREAMEGMLIYGEREKIIARRGFSLLDMKRYTTSLGAKSGGFRGDMEDLAELEHPVIVPIDYAGFKHFVVMRGIRDGKVYLADPSLGYVVLSVAEFEKHWDKNTLFMVYALDGKDTVERLALSDRELGVFDNDSIRDGSDIALSRMDMLNRAALSGTGVHSLRN